MRSPGELGKRTTCEGIFGQQEKGAAYKPQVQVGRKVIGVLESRGLPMGLSLHRIVCEMYHFKR